MPPTASRDFPQAAKQRFHAAETLHRMQLNLDACYLSGYTIEGALKALILELTPLADRPAMLLRITSGAAMHRFEVLLALIRDMGVELPTPLARRLHRFPWDTNLRYETGRRNNGETRGFLQTVKLILDWVESHLP